jgi:hypothetical protein
LLEFALAEPRDAMDSSPKPTYERRRAPRFRPPFGYSCRVVVPPDYRCRSAMIYDLSRSGVGLILPEPLPVGANLVIRPAGLTQPDLVVTAQVQHATHLGDERWLLGCSATRSLPEAELRAVLTALSARVTDCAK